MTARKAKARGAGWMPLATAALCTVLPFHSRALATDPVSDLVWSRVHLDAPFTITGQTFRSLVRNRPACLRIAEKTTAIDSRNAMDIAMAFTHKDELSRDLPECFGEGAEPVLKDLATRAEQPCDAVFGTDGADSARVKECSSRLLLFNAVFVENLTQKVEAGEVSDPGVLAKVCASQIISLNSRGVLKLDAHAERLHELSPSLGAAKLRLMGVLFKITQVLDDLSGKQALLDDFDAKAGALEPYYPDAAQNPEYIEYRIIKPYLMARAAGNPKILDDHVARACSGMAVCLLYQGHLLAKLEKREAAIAILEKARDTKSGDARIEKVLTQVKMGVTPKLQFWIKTNESLRMFEEPSAQAR